MQKQVLSVVVLFCCALATGCASTNPDDGGMTGTAAAGRSGGTVSTGTPAATGTTGGGPTEIPGKLRPEPGIEGDQQQEDKHLNDVVIERLAAAGYMEKYPIEVTTNEGIVTVSGIVPTQETANAILVIVKDVENVKDVISELNLTTE